MQDFGTEFIPITGKDLITLGFEPGPWFGPALQMINDMGDDLDPNDLYGLLLDLQPEPIETIDLRDEPLPYAEFLIEDPSQDALDNYELARRDMNEVMRVPTVIAGAMMPDACPVGGPLGTIPVGCVVATEHEIHPGFHSADICCSMMATYFDQPVETETFMDAAMRNTHFGYGKRDDQGNSALANLKSMTDKFDENPFLKGLQEKATSQLMTQGDGNHFLFFGRSKEHGQNVMVTHHGSRGFGAAVYKRGMKAAQQYTREVSPSTPKHNAWLDVREELGAQYWAALQVVCSWTSLNHYAIHHAIGADIGNPMNARYWNPHNFVFRNLHGQFLHAKGATPSFMDTNTFNSNFSIIPLNMNEPVLITRHIGKSETTPSLGFSPHGAGRNMSRTQHMRNLEAEHGASNMDVELKDLEDKIDVRFYSGKPDLSELPSAYKDGPAIKAAIEKHNLTEIVDEIMPLGSIMAGEQDQPWRKKK